MLAAKVAVLTMASKWCATVVRSTKMCYKYHSCHAGLVVGTVYRGILDYTFIYISFIYKHSL